MPQSLSFILVHIIFSTRERQPLLVREVRPDLYAYLAGIVRDEGNECFRVGGTADHVHLAVRMARTQDVSHLLEAVKSSSSRWLKGQHPDLNRFAWQRGYGAFSVGPTDSGALCRYIDNQEAHHRERTFKDEFRAFLKKYKIDYDENYVWD